MSEYGKHKVLRAGLGPRCIRSSPSDTAFGLVSRAWIEPDPGAVAVTMEIEPYF